MKIQDYIERVKAGELMVEVPACDIPAEFERRLYFTESGEIVGKKASDVAARDDKNDLFVMAKTNWSSMNYQFNGEITISKNNF